MLRLGETSQFGEASRLAAGFSPQVWKNLAKWAHSKKDYKPEYLSEPEPRAAIEETCRILSAPLKSLSPAGGGQGGGTITQEIPAELTAALENNIFFFSGFKTHHELVQVSQLLKDENGNFKPFQQFLKDVAKIDNTYNKNYLNAEYNFAQASSQMAVKWKEWEADGDDYDLQYRTAGDDRVREEHAALNGTTLPPSDPFWKSYLPPNGWNCRCTAVQVRKGKHPRSDSEKATAKGNAITNTPKKQIFRFNPGAQEKIFPPKHPYYKAEKDIDCSSCSRRLSYTPGSIKCTLCEMSNAIKRAMSRSDANAHIRSELIGKTITTETSVRNTSGVIRLNSKGLRDFLYNGHSKTSESKWVLSEIYNNRATLGTPTFEELNHSRPNIQSKIENGWEGVNVYTVSVFEKKWKLKTAIIYNRYELPYHIKEISQ